ncbi:hypothetical protein NDU88_007344 [Pleurodeles waltl]|uniref:Uncharacterized protein n=1 Tax=Pleurodeles waltl TaxID=8319 RepID=A0AAV7LRT2_PLEWA|nr:hypothetical protein NDU88_007344 [Pleurodeles waltl]
MVPGGDRDFHLPGKLPITPLRRACPLTHRLRRVFFSLAGLVLPGGGVSLTLSPGRLPETQFSALTGCPGPGLTSIGHTGPPEAHRGPQSIGLAAALVAVGPSPFQSVKRPRYMSRGRAAATALRRSAMITGRPPRFQGPRLCPGAALLRRPMWRTFIRALRPPSAPLLQWGDSSRVPRCSRAVRPRTVPARGSTRGRGFRRKSGPPALTRAIGLGLPASTLRGRDRGPVTPGTGPPFCTSAQTPLCPERVRFCSISSRPLRSEEIRRAPSLNPWPRPC